MPSLVESNPYLRDPELRKRIIAENVYDSSVFEGASGLPKPESRHRNPHSPLRRKIAASKKKRNGP